MDTTTICTLLSPIVEILGMWLTVNAYVREARPGLHTIYIPSGWKAARGPLIITAGILLGSVPDVAPLLTH